MWRGSGAGPGRVFGAAGADFVWDFGKARPLLLAAAVCSGCGGAASVAPPLAPAVPVHDQHPATPAPLTRRIAEVLTHEGQLWVRGADGTLGSLPLPRGVLKNHFPGTTVTDVHVARDGALWVLAADPVTGDARVWKRRTGGWEPIFEMGGPSTPLLAVGELRGRPVVLTRRAAFVPRAAGAFEGVALDDDLRPGRVPQVHFAAVARAGDPAAHGLGYLGTDDGEQGGALYRVDLEDGAVEQLRRIDGSGVCDGPLNPSCDPITAVVADPEQRACVLVGVGLVHTAPRGRLLRVCDREVSIVWQARREQAAVPEDPGRQLA